VIEVEQAIATDGKVLNGVENCTLQCHIPFQFMACLPEYIKGAREGVPFGLGVDSLQARSVQ
jgi:hypothetical protein